MKRYPFLTSILLAVSLAVTSPRAPLRDSASPAAWAAPAPDGRGAKADGEPTTGSTAHLPTLEELRMGRDGAAEAEKHYKIIKDGPQVQRIQAIAAEVLRAADDPALVRAYLIANKLPRRKDNARRA